MDNTKKEMLAFLLSRDSINLYKKFFSIVEDLKFEHNSMLEKLEESLPPEYHHLLRGQKFDEKKFSYIRKKILDAGNEAIRSNQEQLKNFNIS
jgi:hypothetical protein